MSALKTVDKSKLFWYLIYSICLLFLLFYLSMLYNNRINSSDDFYLLNELKKKGLIDSILDWNVNRRIVSLFLFNLTFYLSQNLLDLKYYLFAVYFLFMVFFTHSAFLILQKIKINGINRLQTFAMALLIVASCYFFPFQRNEIWFWYICFLIYLLPFVFINYGFYFLMNGKTFWSCLFFFLAGGCFEPLILSCAFVLLLFFLNKKISFFKLSMYSISLFSLSIINFFSTGITNRIKQENLFNNFHDTDFESIFSHLFEKKNLFFLLLLIIAFTIGNQVKSLNKLHFRKVFVQGLLLLVFSFLVTFAATHLLFGSYGPLRSWAMFSIVLMVLLIMGSFYIGSVIKRNCILPGLTASVIFIGLFFIFSLDQIKVTSKYARAYDHRVKEIYENKATDHKMPDSGTLISGGDSKIIEQYIQLEKNEN